MALNRAWRWVAVLGWALSVGVAAETAADTAAGPVRFNHDIRPILAEYCFHCHGPDPSSRKAGLRFDRAEGFLARREGQPATVTPGDPAASPLYQRISTADLDDIMPPEKAHKPLPVAARELLRRWIAEGAHWEPHWSLIAPLRPVLPTVRQQGWGRSAVDLFVLARLEQDGMAPAPEASRAALIRRVSLDLTGLPPTPAAVAAFVADTAPDAYERVVDALLASPHYGEHRARYWLDVARYADTHGLHFDNYREMWAYRDWVIAAYNTNQPFDQFTIEQIAGDLLPNATLAQHVASGFHRCAMTTNEGGTIEAENLAMYARERVETTSWVWLGLTANCAACHDHKFDPLPTRDFYAFSAFFRNTTQGALDGNVKGSAPVVAVPASAADAQRLKVLDADFVLAQAAVSARRAALQGDLAAWLAAYDPQTWAAAIAAVGEPDFFLPLSASGNVPLTLQQAVGGTRKAPGAQQGEPVTVRTRATTVTLSAGPAGGDDRVPVVHGENEIQIDGTPDFGRNTPYTYGCWVQVPVGGPDSGAVFARMDDGAGYSGWDLWIQGDQFAAHLIHRWPDDALKVRTRGGLKRGVWQHVFVAYDGSGSAAGLRIYIDGVQAEVEVEADALKTASFTTAPFTLARRKINAGLSAVSLNDLRIYARRLPDDMIQRIAATGRFTAAMAKPAAERTPADRELLASLRACEDQPLQAAVAALRTRTAEREALRARMPITHVMHERTDAAAVAYVLNRGQYDQPGEQVSAAVFSALPAMPPGAPKNRLGLAQWLVAADNPLTARVTVNRLWQEIFGTGLVRTTEDFGIMGEAPSHPELLDWLAVEFRDGGWNVKALLRTIVCSATYRQAAVLTPEKLERDRDNRALSRGPRFRMDAEMVRDYALSVAGALSPTIGGPSVKPYQPEGVWESVGMQESDTHRYQRDNGEALYRRSMYTFWKRQAPPASLEVFNAPSRETACLRRERTNTPLQALVTLNDEQFIEAARLLAARVLAVGATAEAQYSALAQLVLCRAFTPDELTIVRGNHQRLQALYAAAPVAAAAVLAVGATRSDPALNPVDLAAMTLLSNLVLNLDETLCK